MLPGTGRERKAVRTLLRGALVAGVLLGWAAPSFAGRLTPELRGLEELRLHVAPDVEAGMAAPAGRKAGQPLQFAIRVPLRLTLADGQWTQADSSTVAWRTRVFSAGAVNLNLEFSRFQVPEGAALWLYDASGRVVQGPYTLAHHMPEGGLWTAIIPGETAVMELRVPVAARKAVSLELAAVNHGFLDIMKSHVGGGSGACNIDVACPQGDAWRAEVRSVARITIGGTVLCTGQLVNTVRQDTDRLFLTADHCGIGDGDVGPASSVVAYWNYERTDCGSGDGDETQNQTGAELLANDAASDFTLIRLNESPTAPFNVYLAGWNVADATPPSGAVVHHPAGDLKKIALVSAPASRREDVCIDGPGCGRRVDAWEVRYSEGTAEAGSSGAGLFNPDRQIVGVLSGGTASCSVPNDPDFYGRLERAWTASLDPAHQLKAHLDPDDTGTLAMNGREPGGISTNTPPNAVNDSFTVIRGSSSNLLSVLANDTTAPDTGETLTIVAVGATSSGGSVAIESGGGALRYTPAPGGMGTETFTYTVTDGNGGYDRAVVTITLDAGSGGGGGGGGGAMGLRLIFSLFALVALRQRLRVFCLIPLGLVAEIKGSDTELSPHFWLRRSGGASGSGSLKSCADSRRCSMVSAIHPRETMERLACLRSALDLS